MAINSSHVLVCRNDNIGDVVLTLPITAWLKKTFPSTKISFMCRSYAAPIVRMCNSVDAVVEMESVAADPVSYFAESGIDTVIFAQPDRRLVKAAFRARVPNRIGNARQKLYQLIFCNRRVRFSKRISPLHEAQFNFEYLRPFGLQEIPDLAAIPALYDFAPVDALFTERFFRHHSFNLIIHPKSNGHGREWPISHYETLAQHLSRIPNLHIWVTGSASEGVWLEQHAGNLFRMPNVTNVCGQFSLDQLMTFIGTADGLIASGTGPLHISAAIGQRTLGLFPPTRPMHPGRWAPIGQLAQTLCMPTACDGCDRKTTMGCECMENISPWSVANIVIQWFEKAAHERSHEHPEMPATSELLNHPESSQTAFN